MKKLNTIKKSLLACAFIIPMASQATILPVGGEYSISNKANHIEVKISDFKLRLKPEYQLGIDGDYLDIRKNEGRVGLSVRSLPGEVGENDHLKSVERSKGEVHVEVVSNGKRYDFYYSDIETNSALVSQHLNRQERPKVVHLDSKHIAVQSVNQIPVLINEAPVINDSGFSGKDGVIYEMKKSYFTHNDKIMMLKKVGSDSNSTIYKRLSSVNTTKMSEKDFDARVDITRVREDFTEFRFTVESEKGGGFLLGNPLTDANFNGECLEFAQDSDYTSERTANGVALKLYLRNDLYRKCMVGKTLLGSVQVFDENLNSLRVRY